MARKRKLDDLQAHLRRLREEQEQEEMPTKKRRRYDPVKALRVKQQLEDIWKNRGLTSPLLRALWTTTRDGDVDRRESKEKIYEYSLE